MRPGIGYQSGIERGDEVRASRRAILRWLLAAAGIIILAIVVLAAVVLHLASQPTMNHVRLTITNGTAVPLSDVGLSDCSNERVVPMGPIAPGQTKALAADYNENECPTGFSFDQSGQTWRVRLDGQMLDYDAAYTVTLTPNLLTATCVPSSGATTRFVQVPSTQPIVYP